MLLLFAGHTLLGADITGPLKAIWRWRLCSLQTQRLSDDVSNILFYFFNTYTVWSRIPSCEGACSLEKKERKDDSTTQWFNTQRDSREWNGKKGNAIW